MRFFRDDLSENVLLYIWNITHGGGDRRSEDEFRIQITGVPTIEMVPNYKTLILGYWEDNDVFSGWDAHYHAGEIRHSPSLQIRRAYLYDAHQNGFAVCPKEQGELAIAFEPAFFISYLRNLDALHLAGAAPEEIDILNQIADSEGEIEEDTLHPLPDERMRVIKEIAKLQRDSSFRKRVLNAYEDTCAFCGLQLELVDAAHIIPVSQTESTDRTNNGVCLCALHHRAFDSGLIAILPDYQIAVNEKRMNYLRANHRDAGEERFIRQLLAQIRLPPDRSARPEPDRLELALEIRNIHSLDLRPASDFLF